MKVGLVLLSSRQRPIPSTRVALLNVLPILETAGAHFRDLYEPEQPSECPVLPEGLFDLAVAEGMQAVIFQKVHGQSVVALATRLRSAGIATIFLVCDLVDEPMARACTATVVVTDFLKSLYPLDLQRQIHVVHDGIERPDLKKTTPRPVVCDVENPLRAVLVTSSAMDTLPGLGLPPPWLHVSVIGAYPPESDRLTRIKAASWSVRRNLGLMGKWNALRFMTHPRVRRVRWTPDGVYRELLAADVGIIPIDTSANEASSLVPAWKVKSENRLTLKMAVGLPVVATPIPSYEPIINSGRNAFAAQTQAQWLAALQKLRAPEERARIGHHARADVLDRFSLSRQAQYLWSVLVDAKESMSLTTRHEISPDTSLGNSS